MTAERDQIQTPHNGEIRKKITAGMTSLRAGESADGEDFLASMDAGLAELERREPL